MDDYELLDIIEQAKKDGVTELDLSRKGLTKLPPEIGKLTNLTRLDLSRNKLIDLPPEIGQLTNLIILDLYENQLAELPPEIGQLTNLAMLDLSKNQYSTLPSEIGQLTSLVRLDVYRNQLINLPPEIGQLTNLTMLDPCWNQLTALPPEINQLTNLTKLNLTSNKLTTLPQEISQLTNLITLYLAHNELDELPPEMGQLTSLSALYLAYNRLDELPPEIGKLSNLRTLNLSWNELINLPPQIGQLTNLTTLNLSQNQLGNLPQQIGKLTNLTRLNLDGNALPIPPEILSRANEPGVIIQDYLAKNRKPLNEAKLVLVGQGRVGKTSLVKRLVENEFDQREPITEGIAIKEWFVTVDDTEIRLNIWDFGGQEIMHATHQFFMTKRTLYLLVLDAEQGVTNSRIDYWLKLIQSFGQDSPIIVISNKSDLEQLFFDQSQSELREQYPTIKAFVDTSCKSGEGIAKLHQYITTIIAGLKHVRDEIPLTWLTIKAELESLKHDYIPYRNYVKLCQARNIGQELEQRILIRLLHDLGVVLNFQDDARLSDTSVLNPAWVTGGVYKIINAKQLKETQGVLRIGQLDKILDDRKRYPREMHLFIIDIMRKFELCFEFEGHTEEKFLIPDLLSKEESALNWSSDSLNFEYSYNFLPGSVISRFMVRMNLFIFQDTRWRYGMMLVYNKNRALIKAIPEHNRIHISIVGPLHSRRHLWRKIYEQFASIHKTIKGLNAQMMDLNPQVKLRLLGNVEQIEVTPQRVKREEVMDLKNRLENIRLRAHPQEYYPTAFLLGQRCYEELGDYTLARQALVKAHEAISMWRSLMREQADEKHKQLSEECVSVYEMLVHCYLVEGDKGKAFEYASIGKGRAFVNTLASSRFDFEHVPKKQADFVPKLEQIRQTRRRIEHLGRHRRFHKQKRRGKQDVLLREEAELWREIEREYPLLTATLTVPTLSVEQASALAQELDATLVEYYRHADGWCAFVLSQDKKGKPFVRYVPLSKLNNDLLAKLVKWRNELRWSNGRNWFLHQRLEDLYEAAIAPLWLKSERVVIAAFERLHLLPLSAAYDGEKYLAEKHTLSFVPSLTALHVVQQERKLHQLADNRVQRLLSVAYPGPAPHVLPNVLEEADAIVERLANVATSKKLHQTEATPENVIRDAPAYDIIHFGCHGRFDVEKPQESGLRLAGKMVDGQAAAGTRGRDGAEGLSESYLTVQRIITELNLKRTRLATLAACLTGEVKLQEGEEHVGLLQAMMAAGVQTVVASLWHVDDAATRFLFEAFYLQEAHLYSSPQAMRYASHFLRQQEKWRHPYYWAAFQVNGFPPLPKKQARLAWPADLQHNIQKDDQQRRVRSMMRDDIIKNAEILLDTMHEFRDEILPALQGYPLSEHIAQQQTDTSTLNIAKALHYIVQDNPILHKMFSDADVGKIRVSETQEEDDRTRTSRQAQKKAKQVSNIVIDDVRDDLNLYLTEVDEFLAGQDDDGPSLFERFVARFSLFRKR